MDLRKKNLVGTLVFPIEKNNVLLAIKTRKIGEGLRNGWGGGQEEGETIEEAAIREFHDESGLWAKLEDLEYKGKVTFHNQKEDGRKFIVEVHMFLLRKWSGVLKPNPEMRDPKLWPISNLPFNEMMPSDKDWLPLVLKGKFIEGNVWHGPNQKEIIRPSEIKIVQIE
jgi:ADP-ribose pyrophosphatase YjhB (NUDIX family)